MQRDGSDRNHVEIDGRGRNWVGVCGPGQDQGKVLGKWVKQDGSKCK